MKKNLACFDINKFYLMSGMKLKSLFPYLVNIISVKNNQSINQSIRHSINQSINKSLNKSINHSQQPHPSNFSDVRIHKKDK